MFSFNSTDVDNDLQDLKKYMSEQKETEKNILVNQSLHIESIIEKGKNLKIHSALLRNSIDSKGFFNLLFCFLRKTLKGLKKTKR